MIEKKRRDRMNRSYMELMQLVPKVQRKKVKQFHVFLLSFSNERVCVTYMIMDAFKKRQFKLDFHFQYLYHKIMYRVVSRDIKVDQIISTFSGSNN